MSRHAMPVAALVALLATAVCAEESEWSRFRGPNGTGISHATTIPVTWTEEELNWKVTLPGAGHSSPVLWGNRLYLTSADPEAATRLVLCLDTADGRTLWQREYPSATYDQNPDNSYATSTPAADADGLVVTWTTPDEVVLLALDPGGRDVWRRNLGPFVTKHGSGTSPVIVGDLVVLANDQEDMNRMLGGRGRGVGKSRLIAVDRKTGETRWQTERRTALAAYSTPCVRRPEGGPPELIFTSTAHGITAVDLATGKVVWEVADVFKDRCVGSPVCAGSLVIASYGYGTRGSRLVAVRPGSADGATAPSVVWDQTRLVPLVPTPLVRGDRLFLWIDDGRVACLDASTGRQLWQERVGGSFYGSPVCVDDRLYCISRKGEVVVLAAADEFKLLARVPLGEPSFATPAVAGGRMYLRTRSHLISIGGRK